MIFLFSEVGVIFFFNLFQNLCSSHIAYIKLKYTLSAYYVPGTVLSALYFISPLDIIIPIFR